MKIKFEIELDTENIEDQEKLEELIAALNKLKERLEES
jgi:hypothetical protein